MVLSNPGTQYMFVVIAGIAQEPVSMTPRLTAETFCFAPAQTLASPSTVRWSSAVDSAIELACTGVAHKARPNISGRCETLIRGAVGTFFGTSRCPRAVHARVPSTAASGTAHRCRPDGDTVAHRLHVPVQVRCKSRKARENARDHRRTRLVNQRRSARRPDKVDQMSRGSCLPATTHLGYTPCEHCFELEPAP